MFRNGALKHPEGPPRPKSVGTAVRGEACVCVVHARPVSAWSALSCCVSRVTLVFVVRGWSTRVAETLRRPGFKGSATRCSPPPRDQPPLDTSTLTKCA